MGTEHHKGQRAEGLGRAPSGHEVVAAMSIGHWLGVGGVERDPAAFVKAAPRLMLDKEGQESSSCSSVLKGPCPGPLPPHRGQQRQGQPRRSAAVSTAGSQHCPGPRT